MAADELARRRWVALVAPPQRELQLALGVEQRLLPGLVEKAREIVGKTR